MYPEAPDLQQEGRRPLLHCCLLHRRQKSFPVVCAVLQRDIASEHHVCPGMAEPHTHTCGFKSEPLGVWGLLRRALPVTVNPLCQGAGAPGSGCEGWGQSGALGGGRDSTTDLFLTLLSISTFNSSLTLAFLLSLLQFVKNPAFSLARLGLSQFSEKLGK